MAPSCAQALQHAQVQEKHLLASAACLSHAGAVQLDLLLMHVMAAIHVNLLRSQGGGGTRSTALRSSKRTYVTLLLRLTNAWRGAGRQVRRCTESTRLWLGRSLLPPAT